jgi:hypothetical protein
MLNGEKGLEITAETGVASGTASAWTTARRSKRCIFSIAKNRE